MFLKTNTQGYLLATTHTYMDLHNVPTYICADIHLPKVYTYGYNIYVYCTYK